METINESYSGHASDDFIPTLVDSDVSSTEYDDSDESTVGSFTTQPTRKKLRWKFHGLSLWLELQEFESDISNAVEDFAVKYNTETIPKSHVTAIYGMTHLTIEEAKSKLCSVKDAIPSWPDFAPPTSVLSDIAVPGRPGQVCHVAWCELTLPSKPEHEKTLNNLYSLFYNDGSRGDVKWSRTIPWKPHCSLAYDNPENPPFALGDMVQYVARHPTLVTKGRRVEAISLWDTNGKLEDWKCLDRVYF